MMTNRTDSPSGDTSQPSIDSTTMAPLCAIFRRHLKEQNLKYTPERADILNAIIERDEIFEAETLMHEMRSQGDRVSKATVYRTLKLLQEAGITIRRCSMENRPTTSWSTDAQTLIP